MRDNAITEAKERLTIPALGAMFFPGWKPGKSCRSPFREDRNPSFSVFDEGRAWKDFAADEGGDAIDFLARARGLSNTDAVKEFLRLAGMGDAVQSATTARFFLVDTYVYEDETGRELFRVDRLENGSGKRFIQYRIFEGKRVNGLADTRRVLWRLPMLATVEDVCLCEGEKCVKALESLGIHATTNSGGSNGWRDEYAESLNGKHVWIMPDNDMPGAKWLKAVCDAFHAHQIDYHIVCMPDAFNDVADLIAAHDTAKGASFVLTKLLCRAERENVTLKKAVAA